MGNLIIIIIHRAATYVLSSMLSEMYKNVQASQRNRYISYVHARVYQRWDTSCRHGAAIEHCMFRVLKAFDRMFKERRLFKFQFAVIRSKLLNCVRAFFPSVHSKLKRDQTFLKSDLSKAQFLILFFCYSQVNRFQRSHVH